MTREEYWDGIASKAILPDGRIRDNFHKRRKLLELLTRYDFHNKHVLEIGCGLSVLTMALMMVNGGMKCQATDTSVKFVEWTNKVSCGNIIAIQAAADNLPFEDKQFDSLFLFDVLEHIKPDERQKSYEEMSRVLKENGMIFINNPLIKGFHNEAFDYGFFDKDLIELTDAIGGRILKAAIFRLFDSYAYQFLVLGRGMLNI